MNLLNFIVGGGEVWWMKLCIEGGVRVGRVINECESVVYRFVM